MWCWSFSCFWDFVLKKIYPVCKVVVLYHGVPFAGWLVAEYPSNTDKCISWVHLLTKVYTEIEVADQTLYLTQSQYTDTGQTTGMPIFRYFLLFPLFLVRSVLRRSVSRFLFFFPNCPICRKCMLIFSIFSYFIFLFLNFLSLFVFVFSETACTHRFSVIFAKVQWHPWNQFQRWPDSTRHLAG